MPARRRGFTLNELLVAMTIAGLLGALAVPRYIQAVECSRATEAYAFLANVAGAQERYCALNGRYAARVVDLDIDVQLPESFVQRLIEVPCLGFGADDGWTLSEASADGTPWQVPLSEKAPPDAPGQQRGWRLCVQRVGVASGLGDYTLVFSHRGFEAADSTVPDEIAPVSRSHSDAGDDADDDDWDDEDGASEPA